MGKAILIIVGVIYAGAIGLAAVTVRAADPVKDVCQWTFLVTNGKTYTDNKPLTVPINTTGYEVDGQIQCPDDTGFYRAEIRWEFGLETRTLSTADLSGSQFGNLAYRNLIFDQPGTYFFQFVKIEPSGEKILKELSIVVNKPAASNTAGNNNAKPAANNGNGAAQANKNTVVPNIDRNKGTLGFDRPVEGSLQDVILRIIRVMLSLIAGVALVFIIIGGFRLVFSQGNSEAVKQAKGTITWAIMGLVLALFAFILVRVIEKVLY